MSHRLLLPPYRQIAHHEGKGNFAIGRYYKWPFRFFYRHKFKMILDLMDKHRIYQSTLDFGSGPAEIFKDSLMERSNHVDCVDMPHTIDKRYDLIVCASVLEFTNLKVVLPGLRACLNPSGDLIVSSPMNTRFSRLYFYLIGDTHDRRSHEEILNEAEKHYFITDYKEWLGLYFAFKGSPK